LIIPKAWLSGTPLEITDLLLFFYQSKPILNAQDAG
jgi:hypothetical protein